MSSEFISEFAFTQLYPTIKGIMPEESSYTIDGGIAWFWREAPSWSAATQEEFNNVAVEMLQGRIRAGVRKWTQGLGDRQIRDRDGKWRNSTNGIREDAEQTAWLNLLERGNFSARDVSIAGQTALNIEARYRRRFTPISQTHLADAKDPFENAISSCQPSLSLRELFEQTERDRRDQIRLQIIGDFKRERREDYLFILDYLASKYKRAHTPKERRRASAIIHRLRRIEATENFVVK